MTGARTIPVLVLAAALIALLVWLCGVRDDGPPEPTARRRVDRPIDYAVLDRAEAEAQAASNDEAAPLWQPPPPAA